MFQGYLKEFPEKLSAVLEYITGVFAKVFHIGRRGLEQVPGFD